MPGVYLHIPFCRQACAYCDFHFSTNLSRRDDFVSALLREIELKKDYLDNKNLDSVYFGGGTPSILSAGQITEIMAALSKHFTIPESAETTLEANPDDISAVSLDEWKKAGINRLSIGLQSFNDAELKWMNRAHSAEQSVSSVKLAQDKGFGNISIDLIYGSRFQDQQTWEKTLQTAIGLRTQHISSYNLTIENKTVLGSRHSRGIEPAVNDELSSLLFMQMRGALTGSGFRHYEISNFAQQGFFAKHNSSYWHQESYLGLGPSAHSFNGVSRQWNVRNNNVYFDAVTNARVFFEKEELTTRDLYNEYIMTRLRTIWGCDVAEMKRKFGEELTVAFEENIKKKTGFISHRNGVYTLTEAGMLHADGIASDLFLV